MRHRLNGIDLNVESWGSGPSVLLLHGFTGSSATWKPFQDTWPDFRLIAPDLIGHGSSDAPAEAERYTIAAAIGDLRALLDSLSIDRCSLLGYSLGGRIAMRFALAHPERLWGLVLESTSPGVEDAADRTSRVKADEALAERIESEGIPGFVDYWQSIPLWASQAGLAPETRLRLREQRLANSPRGLANSLRGMGACVDEPVHEALAQIQAVPALILAGSLDERYARAAAAMAGSLPNAELNVIQDAGHAVHLEQPDAFAKVTADFLVRHAPLALRGT